MSRPSIPKLSLAFKKAATADTTAPLSAQPPEKGPLKIPALGPANGSLSAPMAAIAMPKLNLPARQQANGASAPPQEHKDQPPPDEHHLQGKGAQEGQHSVYLLVPGLAFPTHSAPGGPPLTVGGLKALCYDNLCPPLPPSSSSSSSSSKVSSPPQLEFFRLSALVRLTDDTIPAPPGLVVAGAHLQHQDLTLGLVERLVAENKGLRERMDLAGEALVTLEERAERDAATIRHLRETLDTISAQHRALQDKHAAMALLLQPSSPTSSSSSSSSSSSTAAASSSSSSLSTSLAATPSSGSASLSAPASASVSPRGTSPRPSYHYGIGGTSGGVVLPQHPHTLSQTPRSFHNSFPSLTSPRSPSRPTGPFSPRNGEGLISPATSPRRRLACRTGNCTCNAFTPQPSASWICVCGHMSLKHAGGPP